MWTLILASWASAVTCQAAPAAARTPRKIAPRPLQISYRGTVELEAHFRHPGETRSFESEQTFYRGPAGHVRLDWTTWAEGDSSRVPETYIVSGDSVFYREAPDARWQLLAGERARLGRIEALAGIPEALLSEARSHAPPRSLQRFLRVRGTRLEELVMLRPHPRLGDVRDSVSYSYISDEQAPRDMLLVLHERDQQWRLVERRASWSRATAARSLFAVPARFDPPAPPDTLAGEPRIVPLAPGIWSADMEDIDSRTLIVEFADHLALIEFAVGSANGERLADVARKRWPQKPIRYALFSHYHPHYAGGLRAMIAEGATVITTPGNENFVRGIAALPFTIEPDRLARSPRPLKIQAFTDRFELTDSTNQLVAFNYGARSQHTDEFAVFWFPRAKLLFETELGWVRAADGTLRASRRAAPLLAWLDEQKLDVKRIVQSWPMRGNAPEESRAELDSLVHAAK